MKKSDLPDLIDWAGVLSAPRESYGHEEVMRAVFGANAEVIAEWIEDGHSGKEAFAYLFADGSVAVLTDYFGSCSHCDSWIGLNESEARAQLQSMVNSSRLFPGVADAVAFCTSPMEAEDFPFKAAANLADQLRARMA